MLRLALLVELTVARSGPTSRSHSTDCPAHIGNAERLGLEDFFAQEDADQEAGALSLVQKRVVEHFATKLARPRDAAARKSSGGQTSVHNSLATESGHSMQSYKSRKIALMQKALLRMSSYLVDKFSPQAASHGQDAEATGAHSHRGHRGHQVSRIDNSGFTTENTVIVICIVVLFYCCLGVYFLPDPTSCFPTFARKSCADDLHEDSAWHGYGPAGSSLLMGSGEAQSGPQGSETAETSLDKPFSLPAAVPPVPLFYSRPKRQPTGQGSHLCMSPSVVLQSTPRLLLPLDIFDRRHCGPFELTWSEDEPSGSPHLSLLIHDNPGELFETWEFFDPRSGTSSQKWLYGSVRHGGHYILDNKYAQSESKGLSYRRSKDLNERINSRTDGVSWGSMVFGIDEGDGWLQVGHKYLPMTIDGVPMIFPTSTDTAKDDFWRIFIDDNGAQPYACIKAFSTDEYAVEQKGLEVMTLHTDSREFCVEAMVGTTHIGGILKQKQNVFGSDYMELSVKPGADPMLVLLCSLAVARKVPEPQAKLFADTKALAEKESRSDANGLRPCAKQETQESPGVTSTESSAGARCRQLSPGESSIGAPAAEASDAETDDSVSEESDAEAKASDPAGSTTGTPTKTSIKTALKAQVPAGKGDKTGKNCKPGRGKGSKTKGKGKEKDKWKTKGKPPMPDAG